MSNDVTTDLSEFGTRELIKAGELLKAIAKGLPGDFYNDQVHVAFNRGSGWVFLTNAEYQVAILDGGELVSFYSSPWEGLEGTAGELAEQYDDMHPEDQEWARVMGIVSEIA